MQTTLIEAIDEITINQINGNEVKVQLFLFGDKLEILAEDLTRSVWAYGDTNDATRWLYVNAGEWVDEDFPEEDDNEI